MRCLILAGGRGSRLSEETDDLPKPLVSILGRPILWHIIQTFLAQNFTKFTILTGYKGHLIEDFVENLDIKTLLKESSSSYPKDSRGLEIETLFTGEKDLTGSRIKQAISRFDEPRFFVTYGDGLSDVNLGSLLRFHLSHHKFATLTAVRPPARFGHLTLEDDCVINFAEKNQLDEGWINGGFFVLERSVAEYIQDDTPFEEKPLSSLSQDRQLMAFKHFGFWRCIDTVNDKRMIERAFAKDERPWLLTHKSK